MNCCDVEQILHPELMSTAQLLEILKSRCIKLPDDDELSRAQILDIYFRLALPLEQRAGGGGGGRHQMTAESKAPSRTARSRTPPVEAELQCKIAKYIKKPSPTLKRTITVREDGGEPIVKKQRMKITWP